MEENDRELALQLQAEYDRAQVVVPPGSTVVDASLELTDPTPDIHALFRQFNDLYFWSKLDNVEVRWSPRMTLCAGLCHYEGRGGLCSIRLSKPLLTLRPRQDLVQTLLHEMIHAFLFVTFNNKDHDAHGPEFLSHMKRINKLSGAKITVYHNFHDEVNLYKTHWWQCDGPCRHRAPFYGLVKRSMNRAPGPYDLWWSNHVQTCGGTFTKIKSPEEKNDTKKKNQKRNLAKENNQVGGNKSVSKKSKLFVPFSGQGHLLGDPKQMQQKSLESYFRVNEKEKQIKEKVQSLEETPKLPKKTCKELEATFTCPVCSTHIASEAINSHLDQCLQLF